jgi:hypothetical protein
MSFHDYLRNPLIKTCHLQTCKEDIVIQKSNFKFELLSSCALLNFIDVRGHPIRTCLHVR